MFEKKVDPELELELDVPEVSDNGPRPEDGDQPDEEEVAELLAALLNDEYEDEEGEI